MRIPKAVLGGFLVLVLVAAGVYFLVLDKSPDAPGKSGGNASATPPAPGRRRPDQKTEAAPLPVKVSKAVIGDLVMTLKSPGEAYTEKRVVLKAEAGGVVKNLYAAEGRHVREGDLLVELDDREYRLSLERLEAQRLRYLSELFLETQFSVAEEPPSPAIVDRLTKAQSDYDRVSEAFKRASPPDRARQGPERFRAGADRGRPQEGRDHGLDQEPDPGRGRRQDRPVGPRKDPHPRPLRRDRHRRQALAERADRCRPRALTLVDISRIKVKAKVLESEVGKMDTGRDVDLRFSAFPGRTFKGVIEAVSPVINSEDRTCWVYVAMDNPSDEIKPGMHAEVEFPPIPSPALLVPQHAILVRGGRSLSSWSRTTGQVAIHRGRAREREVRRGPARQGAGLGHPAGRHGHRRGPCHPGPRHQGQHRRSSRLASRRMT